MATENRPNAAHPEDVRNPGTRYERRQGNVRGVLLAGAALVVIAALLHFFLLGLFSALKQQYMVRDINPNPIQTAEPHRLPPAPRLQPDPVGDLHKLRQQEDDILE